MIMKRKNSQLDLQPPTSPESNNNNNKAQKVATPSPLKRSTSLFVASDLLNVSLSSEESLGDLEALPLGNNRVRVSSFRSLTLLIYVQRLSSLYSYGFHQKKYVD